MKTRNYVNKANKIFDDIYNYDKTVYTSSKNKLVITCKIHGDFEKRADVHLSGQGCPTCSSKIKSLARTTKKDENIEKANKVHNNIYDYSLIDYTGQRKEYDIICKKHGIFKVRFDKHLSGRGCQKCSIESRCNILRLPLAEVLNKIAKVHGDKYDTYNLNYKGSNYKMTPTCKKHGDFEVTPQEFFNGSNCPYCAVKFSKAEIEIKEFIEKYQEIEHSNRKILKNKFEIDIYIPSLKIAIEYNGLYYHSDKFHKSNYHLNKTIQCRDKGIRLIHIFEDEWIHKKDIVKSKILEIIKETPNIISVDACEVKNVTPEVCKDFLDKNSLDKYSEINLAFGLYYEDELISIVCQDKDLIFCNKMNTIIHEGFKKLISNFSGTLTTTVDLRWSQGELHEKLGFKLLEQTKPKFFYIKGQNRVEKIEEGFRKIYDCGTLKYIKNQKTIEWKNY